ncbi:hypothetical protein BC940DRAFT_346512 [Gongronella butleri]|nr:hypothetical protein BC940DRAFT_346512 [Gongronella butleri]
MYSSLSIMAFLLVLLPSFTLQQQRWSVGNARCESDSRAPSCGSAIPLAFNYCRQDLERKMNNNYQLAYQSRDEQVNCQPLNCMTCTWDAGPYRNEPTSADDYDDAYDCMTYAARAFGTGVKAIAGQTVVRAEADYSVYACKPQCTNCERFGGFGMNLDWGILADVQYIQTSGACPGGFVAMGSC